MSTPRVSQVFTLLHPGPAQGYQGSIEELIRKCDDDARARIPSAIRTGCLLQDIGNYLVRAQQVLALVAESLVDGPHMRELAPVMWEETERDPGLPQISQMDYFEKNHKALTNIRKSMCSNSSEVTQIWSKAPKKRMTRNPVSQMPSAVPVPMEVTSTIRSSFSSPTTHSIVTGPVFGQIKEEPGMSPADTSIKGLPSPTSGDVSMPSSPHSAAAGFVMTDLDIEALKSRGKSTYKCSYGLECTKGGVDKYGNIVVFERHCMIRQHMEKHSKPYKCNRPGCPNKNGFARKDQLERHLKLVNHDKVP